MSARAALDNTQGSVLEAEAPELLLRPFGPRNIVPLPLSRPGTAELDHAVLAQQLDVAHRIQQSLLPRTFPALPGFDLAGFCHSAHQVGGDYYDVLPLSRDLLLVMIADVMGKGIPAALFSSTLRTIVRSVAESTWRPAEILARMNRLLFEQLSLADMFITGQVAVADVRRQDLLLANAGHCPVLFTNGFCATKTMAPEGPPLGIVPDAEFAQQSLPFNEFTCALFYTDGLTDACNGQGELFGQPRLEQWLSKYSQRKETAAQLKQHFLAEMALFQGNTVPPDDQTFLLLVRDPSAPKGD